MPCPAWLSASKPHESVNSVNEETVLRMATPWTLAPSNVCGKCAMPDDDQIEVLRSVLAHAYEKRQPLLLRLIQAVKDNVGTRTPRKPIIESLNIFEKDKDLA
jgi:hypothetical protein